MAQHDYSIANALAAAVRSDMNDALAAIVSQNSGTSAPSETFAHMLWYDTTNNILKSRNSADDAWIDVVTFDQSGGQAFFSGKSVTRTLLTSGVAATYNPPTGVRALRIVACGGGGGGGGVDGQGAGTAAQGANGGGGNTVDLLITSLSASYTYTIGDGGSGGGVISGGDGGNTTFTDGGSVSIVASGGAGGAGMTATSGDAIAVSGNLIASSGGDRVHSGSWGSSGRVVSGSITSLPDGSSSYFAQGRRGQGAANGNGGAATSDSYGTGGIGATSLGVSTNYTGGDGAPGVIEIWEIY